MVCTSCLSLRRIPNALVPPTDMQYGLAIITSLLTAKLVGDMMNHSFYELLLHFKMFPYLAWEPPHDFQQVRRDAL